MYYNIGADLKNVRSCNLHTFLDRSIFKILHLISFLLVHLHVGFTILLKLQSVNRATKQFARYDSIRFLHGTVRLLNGTVRFLYGTIGFLNGTERFLHCAFRFLHRRFVSLSK